MSEHDARVLLSLAREARGRPVQNDEMAASAPVIGRLLLESDSTQTRSLEGRSLTMYSALRLSDRSSLRLLNAPRAGTTTSPLSSLAQEVEKWKTDRL
jgi:hypothetical protein